jgi:hypothetical protein
VLPSLLIACPKTPATTAAIDTPEVTTTAAVENAPAVVDTRPYQEAVLLYDRNFGMADMPFGMQQLNQFVYGNGPIFSFSSWDELVGQVQQYSRIGNLTIFSHGNEGHLILNGVQIAILDWLNEFDSSAPQIDTLNFDGCNIGCDPKALALCHERFQSSVVEAWNWFHYTLVEEYEVGEADTAESMRVPHLPEQYVIPGAPTPAELAEGPQRQVGLHKTAFEWFYRVREEMSAEDAVQKAAPSRAQASRQVMIPLTAMNNGEPVPRETLRRVVLSSVGPYGVFPPGQ